MSDKISGPNPLNFSDGTSQLQDNESPKMSMSIEELDKTVQAFYEARGDVVCLETLPESVGLDELY